MSLMVSGGVGFIGANFVLDWLSLNDEVVINLDVLTYAGNFENLASLSNDARHIFVQGDIGDTAGFVVLSDTAEFLCKTTDYWFPEYERSLRWDDPALAIDWKLTPMPAISGKDAQGKRLTEAECFA